MNNNYYCIIMAGGMGRRFWPYSRKALPKQFLDFFGTGQTLLQQTFDRYKKIIPTNNIYITTHKDYKQIVLDLLPEITEGQLIIEEERRNTAPSIAYASHIIQKINPDATIVVAPSDHLILKVEEFKEDDKRINIMAVIYVERSSQKGIIIGSQGEALKKVGTQARLDIEAFFGKKVFLNLYVKVLKDWRNKDSELKNFGYANK